MLSNNSTTPSNTDTAVVQECDLCIIGAGLAGLNALFAAAEYLPPNARVIMVDRNLKCGGMWNETYEYVRLHQPHPMFTAGNIAWDWNKPKGYLAARTEILGHFQHCIETLRGKVELIELYGVSFEGCEEFIRADAPMVRIQCWETNGSHTHLTIEAHRMINAIGYDIPVPVPLTFSSGTALSTTPQRLLEDIAQDASGDVYIVGGGKTGMDTILTLLQHRPGVRCILINGKGTVFGNRNLYAPEGIKRWWHGHLSIRTFADIAMRFDGSNESSVFSYFRKRFTISPDAEGEQFFFGLLSEEENETISEGLSGIVSDYMEDVVETDQGAEMVLRSGVRLPVASGSAFVNCTGHILRDPKPYQPYISEHGTILTISTRSAIHFLSSVSAYFLTHMFFLGHLPHARLYAMDFEALLGKGRKVWQMSGMTLSFMNTILLLDTLPFKVMDKCGLDLDRWFPLPRRLAALLNIKWNKKRYLVHCRNVLDTVAERYGIRCGVLTHP